MATQQQHIVNDIESFAAMQPLLLVLRERPGYSTMRTVVSLYEDVLQPLPASFIPKLARRAHADNEARLLNETLARIARHLRERIAHYQSFYSEFKKRIPKLDNQHLAGEHIATLEDAIESVKKLSSTPTDPEEVHDVLRKVSAAAHALVFVQQEQIKQMEEKLVLMGSQLASLQREYAEVKQKLDPDRTANLVKRLRNIWTEHQIKYENRRGSRVSASSWLRDNLVRPDRFSEEEIQLIPTAVYRQLDASLYRALMDARANGAAYRSNKLQIPTTRQATDLH